MQSKEVKYNYQMVLLIYGLYVKQTKKKYFIKTNSKAVRKWWLPERKSEREREECTESF